MRMDLGELLKKGLIEKFKSGPDQVGKAIENADKSLKTAEKILEIEEWGAAHFFAYTACFTQDVRSCSQRATGQKRRTIT